MKYEVRFVFAVLALLLSIFAHAEPENIDMFTGEVKVLGRFDANRIAIGNGKVLRLETRDEGELIVIGEGAGSSSLRIWSRNGSQQNFNIRVSETDPEKRVRMENMIRMKVKMIEVRKSALTDIGIDWASSINGPAASVVGDFASSRHFRSPSPNSGIEETLPLKVSPFSTHFGLATSITSQINILASGGDATILAEPTLSCVNGGTANFLAGGEVPYPVIGNNGQTSVEFKEYGIKLDVSPVADANGRIYTKILTEISQIDSAVTVLGTPGLLTRRAQTEVNVLSGQTIVVSGLLSRSTSKDASKVPFLGDVPVIGRLFRNESINTQETELVIFVTPEVVAPEDIVMDDRQQSWLEFAEQQSQSTRSSLDMHLMD